MTSLTFPAYKIKRDESRVMFLFRMLKQTKKLSCFSTLFLDFVSYLKQEEVRIEITPVGFSMHHMSGKISNIPFIEIEVK